MHIFYSQTWKYIVCELTSAVHWNPFQDIRDIGHFLGLGCKMHLQVWRVMPSFVTVEVKLWVSSSIFNTVMILVIPASKWDFDGHVTVWSKTTFLYWLTASICYSPELHDEESLHNSKHTWCMLLCLCRFRQLRYKTCSCNIRAVSTLTSSLAMISTPAR